MNKVTVTYKFHNESHLSIGGIVKGIIYKGDEEAWTLECIICHNGLQLLTECVKPSSYMHKSDCPNKGLF